MNNEQNLCRMNLDVAFYLKGDTEELGSNKYFDKICSEIEKALENICCDVQIDIDSFEVLD